MNGLSGQAQDRGRCDTVAQEGLKRNKIFGIYPRRRAGVFISRSTKSISLLAGMLSAWAILNMVVNEGCCCPNSRMLT